MSNLLKHPVIAAIIASLILSFLAWVGGFVPIIWQWLKDSAASIYSFIIQDISLPLWLLVIISLPLTIWSYNKIASYVFNKNKINSSDIQSNYGSDTAPIILSDDERRIMTLFINADGKSLQAHHIKYTTRMPALKIEQIIEALEKKDLIEMHSNYIDGESLWLTKRGRDFMIGNEYTSA